MRFRDIKIGEWFRFDPGVWTFDRACVKVSPRCYKYHDNGTMARARVGSINARVHYGYPRLAEVSRTIAEAKRTATPRYGIAADGYTVTSGAPTSVMVRLTGETRWRRIMVWQFSNAGTAFIRIAGVPTIVYDSDIPEIKG